MGPLLWPLLWGWGATWAPWSLGFARVAPERAALSLASSPESEARFAELLGRFAQASDDERVRLRGELGVLHAQLQHTADGLEPLARALLALASLPPANTPVRVGVRDARVLAEVTRAEVTARPLIEGPPGVANDFGALIHGIGARRLGQPELAVEVLRPLIGKFIDPFAMAIVYDELIGAYLDQMNYEEALVYADGWLRFAPAEERKVTRARISRALARIPGEMLEAVLEVDPESPQARSSRRSPELLLLVRNERDRVVDSESAAEATFATSSNPGGESRSAAGGGQASTTAAGAGAGNLGLPLPALVDPRAVGLVVPATAPELSGVVAALAGAAATEAQRLGMRVLVFDSQGTSAGVSRAIEAAEHEGVGFVAGGVLEFEAAAIALAARAHGLSGLLLRPPKPAPPAPAPNTTSSYLVLGPSVDEERRASVAAAGAAGATGNVGPGNLGMAIVEGLWSAEGDGSRSLSGMASTSCLEHTTSLYEPAFPIRTWVANKVERIVFLGDAGCGRRLLRELADAKGFRPELILGPSAIELVAEGLPMPHTLVAPTPLVGSPQTPLRLDSGKPVSMWAGLGHDVVLAAHHVATAVQRVAADGPTATGTGARGVSREVLSRALRAVSLDGWVASGPVTTEGRVPVTFKTLRLAGARP